MSDAGSAVVPPSPMIPTRDWRRRLGGRIWTLLLASTMACLFCASLYVSLLVLHTHENAHRAWRYNNCWLAGQALIEFTRLEQRIASFAMDGTAGQPDEVALRLVIMESRLGLLTEGDFVDFANTDPEIASTVAALGRALDAVEPLVRHIETPGNPAQALAILRPLESGLSHVVAIANSEGASKITEDEQQLVKLHWTFSAIVAGLVACGIGMLLLIRRNSRTIERANDRLHGLAADLSTTSDRLRLQNERFDAALNNMSQALCMVDRAGRLVIFNKRFCDLFAMNPVPIGTPFAELPVGRLCALQADQAAAQLGVQTANFHFDMDDGRSLAVTQTRMLAGGWVATYEDVSDRRRAEAQIAYLAHHDGLTGLVNRSRFQERLERAGSEAARSARLAALLCIDLDGFKDVNDRFGHPTGDALLCRVASRLTGIAGAGDIVARLGGDEFAVLQGTLAGPADSEALAARIVAAMTDPFDIDGLAIKISASVGIALAPRDGTSADGLVKRADMALYRAKSEGRQSFRSFVPDMDVERRARLAIEADLREALNYGQLVAYYQPQVDGRTTEIAGFEALLRWDHPERGLILPQDFIDIAEDIGVIVGFGEWMLEEACRTAATWPSGLAVSVNLSPLQFKGLDLVGAVMRALDTSGLDPRRLELEITETVLLDDGEETLAVLHRLQAIGIRIALDDFGTGYSSLSYLRSFPFDKIKVDQSFVREMTMRPDCMKIVRSVVELGKSLGMTITAEGVETVEQLIQLQAAGCDQLQGYLFGRPLPADRLSDGIRHAPDWLAA